MMHRVLVVEDDYEIRETLLELLEEAEISAVGAMNGRDALQKLRAASEKPCLILLDLMMPVMDGRAFRSEQLAEPELRDIPVVIFSAFRDLEDEAKALGAATYLPKPLKIEQIRDVVDRFC
jgi:CheY-like chemotaxis protein